MSTCRSKRPRAVLALRGVAAFSLPSRAKSSPAVGKEPCGHGDDRGAGREARGQLEYLLARPLVQRQQHACDGRCARAVRGQRTDHQVGPVPGRHHHAPRRQRLQQVRQHRAAEHEVQRVPRKTRVVTEQHRAVQSRGDLRDGRRRERRVVGQYGTRHRQCGREPLRDHVAVRGGHPVHDHREHVAAQAGVRAVRVARLGLHRLRVLVLASDHPDHRGAELVGEAGVQGQLVGELRGGEVGAEDEDHLVVRGHPVEALDEPGDQFVGTLLRLDRGGLVVVEAVDGPRVLGEPVAGPQQFEEPVRVVVDQGPEDPDPVHLTRQELHDSQIDDLAAVSPVDPGHVHAARHACSPVISCPTYCPVRVVSPF